MKPVPLIRFNGYVSASTPYRDNDNGVLSVVSREPCLGDITLYQIFSILRHQAIKI